MIRIDFARAAKLADQRRTWKEYSLSERRGQAERRGAGHISGKLGLPYVQETIEGKDVILVEHGMKSLESTAFKWTKTDPPPRNGSLYSSKLGSFFTILSAALPLPPGYLNGLFIVSICTSFYLGH